MTRWDVALFHYKVTCGTFFAGEKILYYILYKCPSQWYDCNNFCSINSLSPPSIISFVLFIIGMIATTSSWIFFLNFSYAFVSFVQLLLYSIANWYFDLLLVTVWSDLPFKIDHFLNLFCTPCCVIIFCAILHLLRSFSVVQRFSLISFVQRSFAIYIFLKAYFVRFETFVLSLLCRFQFHSFVTLSWYS